MMSSTNPFKRLCLGAVAFVVGMIVAIWGVDIHPLVTVGGVVMGMCGAWVLYEVMENALGD